MSPEEVTQVIGYLLAAYRPREWSDASSAVYIEQLAEEDYEVAMDAVRSLVASERFMPAVSEILATEITRETRRRLAEQGPPERPLHVVPKAVPIEVDMADVERRKAEIRAAKEKLG